MREIKFRFWNGSEMLYRGLFEIDPKTSYVGAPMQFTGLHDKNGKEVYEGDILSFDGNMTADDSMGIEPNGFVYDENNRHAVIWNDELACWDLRHDEDTEWKYKRDTHGLLLDSTAIEIIGNIYENPDLLTK